jgi:hypothetical protein
MRAAVLALLCASVACSEAASSDSPGSHAVRLSDGSYDFYAGTPQAMEEISAGAPADEQSPFIFYKLHAPAAAVEAAFAKSGKKVFTISLEEAQPDFELVVHIPARSAVDQNVHIVRRPGKAWTTGIAQIYFPYGGQSSVEDATAYGMFELSVYRPSGTESFKTISTATYRNGSTDDPEMPVLKYSPERMREWPPLPEHWK